MKNIKSKLSLLMIAVSASSYAVGENIVLTEGTLAEQDLSSSTVIVDDVKIEIKVNKSTIETLKIPQLTEDNLASTYLPGAFEPTAAGEAEATNEVTQNVNSDALYYSDKSKTKRIAEQRSQDKEKVKSAQKTGVRFNSITTASATKTDTSAKRSKSDDITAITSLTSSSKVSNVKVNTDFSISAR